MHSQLCSLVLLFGYLNVADASVADGFLANRASLSYDIGSTSTWSNDLYQALGQARARKVSELGTDYIRETEYAEGQSLVGFMFEQRYVRLTNTDRSNSRIAEPGHEIYDVFRMNQATGRESGLQLYAGRDPRTAMEKLLVSDKEADGLVIASDTYDAIERSKTSAESSWHRYQTGEITLETSIQGIREALSPLGIYVSDTGFITYGTGKRYSVALGYLDEPGWLVPLSKLERWRERSGTLLAMMNRARIEFEPSYGTLVRHLGGNADAYKSIAYEIKQQASDIRADRGLPIYQSLNEAFRAHSDRAKAWSDGYQSSYNRAAAAGLPLQEVEKIFAERADPTGWDIRGAQAAVDAASLEYCVSRPYAIGGAAFLTIMSIGGAVQYLQSGKSGIDWIASRDGRVFLLQGGTGIAAMGSAYAVERAMWNWSLSGANGGRCMLRSFAGFGVATAVFVIGDILIQQLYYGSSWSETLDVVGESTAVITISAGITWGVIAISGASGSWAGPIGTGVGIAVSTVYGAGKQVWYAGFSHFLSAANELDIRSWDSRFSAAMRNLETHTTLDQLEKP